MKKMILAAAAALMAAPAVAADLPLRTAAPAPAPMLSAAPAMSWTGLYVGGQVGYGWGETRGRMFSSGVLVGDGGLDTKGMIGGLHAGYNWQTGSMVFGAEIDLEAAGQKGNADAIEVANRLRGSARLRAGFAFDNALLYATAGVAQGRWKRELIGRDSTTFSTDAELGWTVGAGVEYALSPNWSARLEYRYSDFGKTTFAIPANFFALGERAADLEISAKDHAIRVGVSYRFGGWNEAILARY
jgi:outer membrane immunogenic protein